jgi:hypothetical protein
MYNRRSGNIKQTENIVHQSLTSVFFRPSGNSGKYDDPIPLSDDEDKGKPTGSSMQQTDSQSSICIGKADGNVQSQAQISTRHLVPSATNGMREAKSIQPRDTFLSSNTSTKSTVE